MEAARADGARLLRTRLAVRSARGGFGGGTIDTLRTQVDEAKRDENARRIMRDPWALVDGGRPTAGPAGDGEGTGAAAGSRRHPARAVSARRPAASSGW